MERWTIADIATLQIRAITVPIYSTNTAQQAEFILNHADVKILFVGDQEQYDQALEIAHHYPKLQKKCGNEIYNSITTRSSFLHLGKFY